MKTKSKQTKAKVNQSKTKQSSRTASWVLKNKETGKVYSNWSYPSRTAARKAAKGRRFKGAYTPFKAGVAKGVSTAVDIDPKKLKKGKPAPTPKSESNDIFSFMDWLVNEALSNPVQEPVINTSTIPKGKTNTMNTNTKPILKAAPKRSRTPGAKFHSHRTFGSR